VAGHVLKAGDLLVLGGQVHDRVPQQVGEPERPLDPGGGEVADGHADAVAARLGPELGHHLRRQVDPVHRHPPPAERDRDPPGPDAELERGRVPGQPGQERHHRVDGRRLEQLGPAGLVAPGDPLVEVVHRHGRQPRRGRRDRRCNKRLAIVICGNENDSRLTAF
jgi:hypothetical protein